MQVSSNMEGQLVINRPDSPVITIITTTSYNPALTSAIPCNSLQMNGQFIGNKGLTINEQQNNKHRICRDFVRGSCRRLYCKYPHVQSLDLVVFCHDFQNNKCPRINCKWVQFRVCRGETLLTWPFLLGFFITRLKMKIITANSVNFRSILKTTWRTTISRAVSSKVTTRTITDSSMIPTRRAPIDRCHRY